MSAPASAGAAPAGAGRPPAGRLGLPMMLAAACCFGMNAVTVQIAGAAGLSGPLLVFYRCVVMLLLLVPLVILHRGRLGIAPGEGWPLVLFGLVNSVVGIAYLSSVTFLPVTVAVVILYIFPILIVLAEPFVLRRPVAPIVLVLAIVAFAGVVLVVGPNFEGLDSRGLALALTAAVGAAIQFFCAARMRKTGIATKLTISHLIVLPVTILTLLAVGGFEMPAALLVAPVAVAVTIAVYVVGIALQIAALARVAPSAAGLAFCSEPIFASLFAGLILGERLAGVQYLGAALVVGAIVANVVLNERRT